MLYYIHTHHDTSYPICLLTPKTSADHANISGAMALIGKPSYNGTCKIHRNRTSMKPCIVCKKGTHSMTGYCPCTFRQIYIGQKMKRASDEKVSFDREMDEYVQHLIDTFEPS